MTVAEETDLKPPGNKPWKGNEPWEKCARCSLKVRPETLQVLGGRKVCVEIDRCTRWAKEMGRLEDEPFAPPGISPALDEEPKP